MYPLTKPEIPDSINKRHPRVLRTSDPENEGSEKEDAIKLRRFLILCLVFAALAAGGCAGIQSTLNEWQGNLVGVSFIVETYDNYGKLTLTTKGDKIKLAGNKIEEMIATDDGWVRHYEMSSVLTVTIDGKEMETCGDTVLFAERDSKRSLTLRPRNPSGPPR